jgi:hypothetical protein
MKRKYKEKGRNKGTHHFIHIFGKKNYWKQIYQWGNHFWKQ